MFFFFPEEQTQLMDCFLAYSIVGQGVGSCLLCSKTYLFFHPFIPPCSFCFPLLFPPLAFFSSLLYCPSASSLLPSLLRFFSREIFTLFFSILNGERQRLGQTSKFYLHMCLQRRLQVFLFLIYIFQFLNHYSKQTKSSGCRLVDAFLPASLGNA